MVTKLERKNWIDCIRAFAMILVVLGHSSYRLVTDRYYFSLFTAPIKMPLFFAISGYVFSDKKGNVRAFLSNWFKKLIIPWFCLALILGIPRCFFLHYNILLYLYDLISGEELWFMPCFAIAQVIHFLIRKYGRTPGMVALMCLMCGGGGIFLSKNDFLNFAMMNRALTVQGYYLIGYLFRTYEESLMKLSWKDITLIILLYVGLCVLSMFVYPHRTIDVHVSRYYSLPLCVSLIYIGCLAIFVMARKALVSNSVLNYIGRNTLLLYIWHPYVLQAVLFATAYLHITMFGWGWSIAKTVIAILVCMIFSKFINRYVPFVVGK